MLGDHRSERVDGLGESGEDELLEIGFKRGAGHRQIVAGLLEGFPPRAHDMLLLGDALLEARNPKVQIVDAIAAPRKDRCDRSLDEVDGLCPVQVGQSPRIEEGVPESNTRGLPVAKEGFLRGLSRIVLLK